MELFTAHKQWSTRPDDQRFKTLQELYDVTKAYADTAIEKPGARVDSLRTEAIDGDVQVIGRGNIPARLTYWSFGQLANRVGAPASYLRTLPPTLACQNLNHGLAHKLVDDKDATVSLLFHNNGGLLLRAVTSDIYERIWNWEVAQRLLDMQSHGWEPAKPDMRVIDDKLPLYASDHDMFAFIRHNQLTISEPGNQDGLQRGLIVSNSEVGAGALKMTRFLYRAMCGNHIIWGAQDVAELKLVHKGTIHARLQAWDVEIKRYLSTSASDEESMIKAAKRKRIAATKTEVLDELFGKRSIGLSRKVLETGYDAVQPDQDGDSRTVWGMVQGLTRYSQTIPHADERTVIDRAAGRILEAF